MAALARRWAVATLARLVSYGHDSDHGIKIYLREIGQIPLLKPEEEIRLAARIKVGDAQARAQMIKANLRLVVKIAHDYANFGLPLLDLISEGNIGLMKAVERFDPQKGGRLSTYAAWWIKQSIRRALANQSKTIRLPIHLVDKINKMKWASSRLAEAYGREPTDYELARHLGMTPAKVSRWRLASIRPASLDTPLGEDDDAVTFGEIVGDDSAATPYDYLNDQTMREEIRCLVAKLDTRELEILTLRFGLKGGPSWTLESVGRKLRVTRERVRQLQNIALGRLREVLEEKETPSRAVRPHRRASEFVAA